MNLVTNGYKKSVFPPVIDLTLPRTIAGISLSWVTRVLSSSCGMMLLSRRVNIFFNNDSIRLWLFTESCHTEHDEMDTIFFWFHLVLFFLHYSLLFSKIFRKRKCNEIWKQRMKQMKQSVEWRKMHQCCMTK